MLHDRLVSSGWRDELKEHCKDIIRRKGLEKVTVEELVAEITPKGRGKYISHSMFIYFLVKKR
jgi:enhancer of yellow 2 transcription factor